MAFCINPNDLALLFITSIRPPNIKWWHSLMLIQWSNVTLRLNNFLKYLRFKPWTLQCWNSKYLALRVAHNYSDVDMYWRGIINMFLAQILKNPSNIVIWCWTDRGLVSSLQWYICPLSMKNTTYICKVCFLVPRNYHTPVLFTKICKDTVFWRMIKRAHTHLPCFRPFQV